MNVLFSQTKKLSNKQEKEENEIKDNDVDNKCICYILLRWLKSTFLYKSEYFTQINPLLVKLKKSTIPRKC